MTSFTTRQIVELHSDPKACAIWALCDFGNWDAIRALIAKEES